MLMQKKLIIAIDGPAGSGKSTSAKLVAESLEYLYIDTGAMYRAITLIALRNNILKNEEEIVKAAKDADIKLFFSNGNTNVILNGEDVTEAIRSKEVNFNVSEISRIAGVRNILVDKQRLMGLQEDGVVLEGRDISTVVFPHADLKIFLTASIEQRASRRLKEFADKGIEITLEEVVRNLEERDRIDSSREVGPLRKAEDAIEVDTSQVTIQEQVELILKAARAAM